MKKLLFILFVFIGVSSFGQILSISHRTYLSSLSSKQKCQDNPIKVNNSFRVYLYEILPSQLQFNFKVSTSRNGIVVYTKDTTVDVNGQQSLILDLITDSISLTVPNEINIFSTTITASSGSFQDSETFAENGFAFGSALCNEISGKLYIDKNQNCIYDAADSSLAGKLIRTDKENILTDVNGNYSILFPDSSIVGFNYPLSVTKNDINTFHSLSCDTEKLQYYFLYNDTIINIPYERDGQIADLSNFNLSTYKQGDPCDIEPIYFYAQFLTNAVGLECEIFYGDGHSEKIINNMDTLFVNASHQYDGPGVYNAFLQIKLKDSVYTFPFDPVIIYENCGDVGGILYKDFNQNCLYDSISESPYVNQTVSCVWNGGTMYTSTDNLGKYAFSIPVGESYNISLMGVNASGELPREGLSVCPKNRTGNTYTSQLHFGVSCINGLQNFVVSQSNSDVRPGFNAQLYLVVQNFACEKRDGSVSFELDTKESFLSSTPSPNRIIGNKLEWDFTNVGDRNNFSAIINIKLDSTAVIGDSSCRMAIATPLSSDANPVDNESYRCAIIRGSYDPNDKTAYVNRGAKTGSDLLAGDDLRYQIRFQNTGTDTAFNIYLLDTISTNLDLNTFEVVSSSHKMKTYIQDNRVIRFEFNDILLPDDKTNEPNSHGYVLYDIKPLANLPIGTKINNTAYIYFDYNLPIVTNTTENELVSPDGISENSEENSFILYPNPANQELKIKLKSDGKAELKLMDILGKTLIVQSFNKATTINTGQFNAGVYLVSVNQNGISTTQKVIINR